MVNADLRGFGRSDGVGTVISDQEAEDYHDLVEWAGTQPWSSGRIGLNGVSYLALSQYKVAALRPEHVAAICPWEGFSDVYRDFARPGGVREDGFILLGAGSCAGRDGRPSTSAGSSSGGRSSTTGGSPSSPTSRASRCRPSSVPASPTTAFTPAEVSRPSAASPRATAGSTRTGVASGRRTTPPRRSGPDCFFDCFLKGEDNGMRAVPPVRVALHDAGDRPHAVRDEPAWPPPAVEWIPRFLSAASGNLEDEPTRSLRRSGST